MSEALVRDMASDEKKAFSYSCEICGVESASFSEYESHIKSREHLKEIKAISKNPGYEDYCTTRPQKYTRRSIIPCSLCNMEMSGPISYQQHIEGRFHSTLLQQRMAQAHLYSHTPEHPGPWRRGRYPEENPFFGPPMCLNHSFPFYQGLHYRWNPNYIPRVRGSSFHYYAEGYYHPSWYSAGAPRQHSSHSSPRRSYSGLFRCRICDTHHRSWSHYSRHLAMEHEIELPEEPQ